MRKKATFTTVAASLANSGVRGRSRDEPPLTWRRTAIITPDFFAAWKPDIWGWRDWSDINDGRAPARAPVTAVSRSKDKLHIFAVDEDSVKTATWELDAGWSDWKWLLPGG